MVYIQELRLINFQTHVDTRISFSPNFNCLIGPTRSGKSSIVRALNFLLYNDWYEDYLRFGSAHASVIAKLSTKVIVARHKGEGLNRIVVKTPDGKSQRFDNFGFTLPKEVAELLGSLPIDIGNKNPLYVNVANQDDPLFLFYEAGPDRAKVLSRITGLYWIDYALKDLNLDRRTKSSEIQLLKETNINLTTKIKEFTDIDLYKEIIEVEKDRLAKLKYIESLYQRASRLQNETVKWKLDYQKLQELKKINFNKEILRLEKLIKSTELFNKLRDIQRLLNNNESSIINTKTYISKLSTSKIELKDKLLEEVKRTPTCEYCGSSVNIDRIVETIEHA